MAYKDRNTFDKPGQYTLQNLEIISYRRDSETIEPIVMEIKGILFNLNLVEDIFTHNIVGSVVVYDMQDIRSLLPITGLEKLKLTLNSPGCRGYDHEFQIYKVDNVTEDPKKETAQLYQIFFCSPELYRNNITTISKAYEGPVENAVLDILRNDLKSNKKFFFEPTATNTKIVIPNLKPYDAIKLLAKNAVPSGFKNNSGYVFYEDATGFHFRSIASMMAMGGQDNAPALAKWAYAGVINSTTDNEKRPQIKDIEKRMRSVIKAEYEKPVDTLANMNNGMYANQVIKHDAFNKTITTTNFDYLKEGDKQPHTEHGKESGLLLPTKKSDKTKGVPYEDTGTGLNEKFDSKVMVKSSTKKTHNLYERPATAGLGNRTSQSQVLRNHNLSLLVYGNTLLNCGDVITFASQVKRPGQAKDNEGLNPYTSGRYVIMAIKHTINIETQVHEMVLKCFKDSVFNAYPSEEETLVEKIASDVPENLYERQLKDLSNAQA